jgi:hypothetical protein
MLYGVSLREFWMNGAFPGFLGGWAILSLLGSSILLGGFRRESRALRGSGRQRLGYSLGVLAALAVGGWFSWQPGQGFLTLALLSISFVLLGFCATTNLKGPSIRRGGVPFR